MSKLTDEELRLAERYADNETARALVAEVKEYRALLATETPSQFADMRPVVRDGFVHIRGGCVSAQSAIAIGAALIRAALEAKGGDK